MGFDIVNYHHYVFGVFQHHNFLLPPYIIVGYVIPLFIDLAVLQTNICQYVTARSGGKDFLTISFGTLTFSKLLRIREQRELF